MFRGFFCRVFPTLGAAGPGDRIARNQGFHQPLGAAMGIVTEKLLFGHGSWTSPKDIQLDIRVHSSNQTWIKHGSNKACWKTFYFSFFLIFPLPKLHWLRGFQQNHEPRLMTPSVLGHWYPIFIHYLDISWFLKPYIKLLFFHIIHDLNLIYSMIIIHQKRLFSPSHYLPWKKPPFSYGFPMVFPFKTSIFAGISPTESIRNFVVARWLARPRPHRKAHSGTLGGGKNRIICDM